MCVCVRERERGMERTAMSKHTAQASLKAPGEVGTLQRSTTKDPFFLAHLRTISFHCRTACYFFICHLLRVPLELHLDQLPLVNNGDLALLNLCRQHNHMQITWESHEDHIVIIWVTCRSHDGHMMVTCKSHAGSTRPDHSSRE